LQGILRKIRVMKDMRTREGGTWFSYDYAWWMFSLLTNQWIKQLKSSINKRILIRSHIAHHAYVDHDSVVADTRKFLTGQLTMWPVCLYGRNEIAHIKWSLEELIHTDESRLYHEDLSVRGHTAPRINLFTLSIQSTLITSTTHRIKVSIRLLTHHDSSTLSPLSLLLLCRHQFLHLR
jgi:hypothetical protein